MVRITDYEGQQGTVATAHNEVRLAVYRGQPSEETGKACTHRGDRLATPRYHKSVRSDKPVFGPFIVSGMTIASRF